MSQWRTLELPYWNRKVQAAGLTLGDPTSDPVALFIIDHGGQISAESGPGRGTTVAIRLPSAHRGEVP